VLCLMLALSTAPWRPSFRLTVQQAVDDGPGLLVISGFLNTCPIETLRVFRGSTQEADGTLNGRYRASWYSKLNTIATMAKTIGQKMLASGPTVPPVSQLGPLNDAFEKTLGR
jgi:hypothetical protein